MTLESSLEEAKECFASQQERMLACLERSRRSIEGLQNRCAKTGTYTNWEKDIQNAIQSLVLAHRYAASASMAARWSKSLKKIKEE